MPGFTIKDGCHYISYITGPSHILLGIKFSAVIYDPELVMLPAQGACSHGHLDADQIKNAVQEGLATLRDDAGCSLYAEKIIYVENDSPRYDIFRASAYKLAKHFSDGGQFQHGT